MIDTYAGRRAAQRRMLDADQAEQTAIQSGTAIFDSGIYDQRVAGAMDDFEPTGIEADAPWQRQDLEVDTAVGRVHEEITRRATVMGASYPFEVSRNQITYRASSTGLYEFCLAVSLAPNLTTGRFVELPRVFERTATILVREYFGVHTAALHVGKPRDKEVGTTFRKAMETLNSLSKEWIWTPYSDLPGNPSTTGDEGVDFVVWKETLDQRNGRLFVIGQCACGDDWADKFNDVSLPRLRKWFHPLSFAEPVRALASPRHVATDWLNEALGSAGLVFDRARLAMIADSAGVGAHLLASKAKFAELTSLVLKASGSLALIEAAKKTKPKKSKAA